MRGLAWVAWLAVTASCGRVGFDSALSRAPVVYVASFVARSSNTGSIAFTAQAQAAGDAIVVHVECDQGATGPTIAATGWTFTPVGPVVHATAKSAQIMFAIAPDTAPASFTAGWSTTCNGMDVIGDELAAGGPVVVDRDAETAGVGAPAITLTTTSDEVTIWGACSSGGTLMGVAPDYTKASDDGHDDWTAYRQTTDPAGTTEHVTFTNSGGNYVLTAVALAGPAVARGP